MLWIVITAALLLFFFFIFGGGWNKLFGKEVSGLNDQVDKTADADNDNVINLIDKCPCKSGDFENDGCPLGVKPTENEDKACLAKKP